MMKNYLKYMLLLSALGPISTSEVFANEEGSIMKFKTDSNRNGSDLQDSILSRANQRKVMGQELVEIPVINVKNTLSGRLVGLSTIHTMGATVEDANLSFRQRNPLVVIDGAIRDLGAVSLQDIETVEVIHDPVLLAGYGMRGANGVLLVTTKQGKEGKTNINVSYQRAIKESTYLPNYLDAYQFAFLANEAARNVGRPDIYSPEALEGYKNNTDPYRYPNMNWYDKVLKPNYGYGRLDVNAAGGGKFARYYVGLQTLQQEGMFRDGYKDFNTNNTKQQYGFRSNVEIDIDKDLRIGLKLAGKFDIANNPGAGSSSIFTALNNTPAAAYPIHNRDGSLFGNAQYPKNIYGELYETGFVKSSRRSIFIDADITRKLDFVTEGLTADGAIHYTSFYDWSAYRDRNSYEIFQPKDEIDNGQDYLKLKDNVNYANGGNYGNSFSRRYNYNIGLNYKKEIESAKIDADLRYNWDQFDIGTALTHAYQGLRGRVNYSWNDRLNAGVSASYEGTEQYPKGNRYGFFPAASLSYDLAKEVFMSKLPFDVLMIKGSYGLLGEDRASNFAYQSYFSPISNAYYFGSTATGFGGWNEASLGNPAITWEKTKSLNVGIQGSLLQRSLSFGIAYYKDKRYDVLQVRGKSNSILGESYPVENIGKYDYSGVELTAGYEKRIGAVQLSVLANAQFMANNVSFIDELPRLYAYQMRTGLPIGQRFGLVALGLFQNETEIKNSPRQFDTQLAPGDIKYQDLNGDGLVNEDDVTAIGTKKMPRFFTLNLNLKYKHIDFQALFNAVTNTDFAYTGDRVWEFQNNGNVQDHHLGRWTPETASTATYPRLTYGTNVNNQQLSTYWLRKGDYLRLKNLQVGYTFKSLGLNKFKIEYIRVFAGAYNLWTLSALDGVDPEGGFTNIPIYRSYNLGLNFKF